MVILFDLDETLVDQKDASAIASRILLHSYKEQLFYDEATFPNIWRDVMKKYAILFNEGKISFHDQRRMRIREIFNQPELCDEEADQRFAIYLDHYEGNWRLFKDVIPCLDSLNRYRKGIVTNGYSVQQRQKLAGLGLERYFEVVLISEELGISKPHPDIYKAASTQLDCDPACCIFIGDNLENDVIGSINAGMHGIWLNRDGQKCYDASIVTIYGLGELKSKIEETQC